MNIINDPFATVRQINNSLNNISEISRSTITRVLINEDFKSHRAKRKPFLTKKHKQQRLEFAKRYKNYTFEDWKKVILIDENRFSLLISDRKPLVRRKRNSSLQERHIISNAKHWV